MNQEQSRLVIKHEGDITQISFTDKNILDEAIIAQIGREIGTLIAENHNPKLMISFTGVEHLSSAALGTLITVKKQIERKDGQLRLTEINKQIYEIFVITKLNKLFKISDTADEAMSSFS